MPWVSGRAPPTAASHAGQLLGRHVGPTQQQQQEVGQVRADPDVPGPQPDAPRVRPNAVQDTAVTVTVAARAGTAATGRLKSSRTQPGDEPEGGDEQAVGDQGQGPATEQRRAVGRGGQQGRQGAELPLVGDRHDHPVHAGHGRGLHGVADHEEAVVGEPAVAAQGGEEQDLEQGGAEHRRDVDRRAQPVEQRPVGDAAAHEDHPHGGHVSARVARRRASSSKRRRARPPTPR